MPILLRFLDAHPAVMALGTGVLTFLLLIVAMEAVCHYLVCARNERLALVFKYDPNPFGPGFIFGQQLKPNFRTSCFKSMGGQPVWDVMYSTDEFGRRTSIADNFEQRDSFAVFFGCSFTFGEGVADEETLPSQFARLAPRYQAYNYGEPGYGPQQMLIRLQRVDVHKEIPQSKGIAVYTFVDDHVRRAIGGMRAFMGWARAYPCYDYVNGELTYKGDFDESRPLVSRLYVRLYRSSTLEYFNIDFPLQVREKDIRLTADIIAESERLFKSQFPGSEFYVMFYPGGSGPYGSRLMPYLKDRDINVLDYAALFAGMDLSTLKFQDEHPNAESYHLVAERLVKDAGLGPRD